MDRNAVITVLESLANGLDPATGATIPHDLFQSADTVRALFAASTMLKEKPPAPARARSGASLVAAGSAWSEQEETLLCQEFDSGMSVAQIALQHGRTSGAITSRLVKVGRIDPATVKTRDRGLAVPSRVAHGAS